MSELEQSYYALSKRAQTLSRYTNLDVINNYITYTNIEKLWGANDTFVPDRHDTLEVENLKEKLEPLCAIFFSCTSLYTCSKYRLAV